MQPIKIKKLFTVLVMQKTGWICGGEEVDVIAENTREARKIGISALESQGMIKRANITFTDVHEQREVYV